MSFLNFLLMLATIIALLFAITFRFLNLINIKLDKLLSDNNNSNKDHISFTRELVHTHEKQNIPLFHEGYVRKDPSKKSFDSKKYYDPELYTIFRKVGKQ